MANYIQFRDILFDDQGSHPLPAKPTTVDPAGLIAKASLSSQINGHYTISSLHHSQICGNIDFRSLLLSYLDTYVEGKGATRRKKNMPVPDTEEIELYQVYIINDFDTDGNEVQEKVRAHYEFHGRPRKDFALLNYPSGEQIYGQVQTFSRSWALEKSTVCVWLSGPYASSRPMLPIWKLSSLQQSSPTEGYLSPM